MDRSLLLQLQCIPGYFSHRRRTMSRPHSSQPFTCCTCASSPFTSPSFRSGVSSHRSKKSQYRRRQSSPQSPPPSSSIGKQCPKLGKGRICICYFMHPLTQSVVSQYHRLFSPATQTPQEPAEDDKSRQYMTSRGIDVAVACAARDRVKLALRGSQALSGLVGPRDLRCTGGRVAGPRVLQNFAALFLL